LAGENNKPDQDPNPAAEPTKVIDQLENLPREKREIVIQTILSKFQTGPLPPHEDLEAYGRIIPDGANRIMQMAEKEQQHRHTREDENDRAEIKLKGRGQSIGGAISGTFNNPGSDIWPHSSRRFGKNHFGVHHNCTGVRVRP
jgi:hypothetical protein